MTEPYFADENLTVYVGDCLEVLARLPANSVDSVCTDPPYGLEFMGKDWDKFGGKRTKWRNESDADREYIDTNPGLTARLRQKPDAYVAGQPFQAWCQLWAAECLRVLKPGGHLLAFGGTRTWHRLTAGIEDAGFEIRDSIAWLYGSGFPKSLDVSKAIDRAAPPDAPGGDGDASTTEAAQQWEGWGTALKPAFEPVVVARKPLAGTVATNVQTHGTGALNIDGCRVGTSGGGNACPGGDACQCGTNDIFSATKHALRREGDYGRWPANIALDAAAADELDKQSGNTISALRGKRYETPATNQIYGKRVGSPANPENTYGDSGGASRFFPTFRYTAKAATTERPTADGVTHPTVKPLDLMRWLIRLVTPPGGVVLDPFAGSGTTAEAAIAEGKRAIVIEREPTYLPLITARVNGAQIGFDL